MILKFNNTQYSFLLREKASTRAFSPSEYRKGLILVPMYKAKLKRSIFISYHDLIDVLSGVIATLSFRVLSLALFKSSSFLCICSKLTFTRCS